MVMDKKGKAIGHVLHKIEKRKRHATLIDISDQEKENVPPLNWMCTTAECTPDEQDELAVGKKTFHRCIPKCILGLEMKDGIKHCMVKQCCGDSKLITMSKMRDRYPKLLCKYYMKQIKIIETKDN
jgi:hypothetical protein